MGSSVVVCVSGFCSIGLIFSSFWSRIFAALRKWNLMDWREWPLS